MEIVVVNVDVIEEALGCLVDVDVDVEGRRLHRPEGTFTLEVEVRFRGKTHREYVRLRSIILHGSHIDVFNPPHIPHEQAPSAKGQHLHQGTISQATHLYGLNFSANSTMSFSAIYFHLPPPFALSLLTSLPM